MDGSRGRERKRREKSPAGRAGRGCETRERRVGQDEEGRRKGRAGRGSTQRADTHPECLFSVAGSRHRGVVGDCWIRLSEYWRGMVQGGHQGLVGGV